MLLKYKGVVPKIADSARLIGGCTLAGNVELKDNASIWPGAVLRGENARIEIGENSNVQDNATVHTDEGFPVIVGNGVSVGHNAVLHGCTVGDNTVVGMGAIVLNGAKIGKNCIIGAGAVVKQGMDVPDGSMVIGIPGVIKRQLRDEEIQGNTHNWQEYIHLSEGYKD